MGRINYISALMIVAVILISCGKDGAPGPAGATGPTGANGITGATGATGTSGATGTANVLYSDWTSPTAYTLDPSAYPEHYYANIPASAITQAVLDNGTVLVYGKLDGYSSTNWPTNQVSELPISVFLFQADVILNDLWSAYVTAGNIRIDYFDVQGHYFGNVPGNQFRYVIIPGGVHTLSSINIHDYKQVALALHLKN